MTDKTDSKEREAFEAWFSSDGKWPRSVERNGDCYKLIQAQQAWAAFQAGRASLAASAGSEPVAQPSDAETILSKVCDLFQIGKLARTESVILTNIRNVIDHAGLLHAVERDLFPQPELPEDDDPYADVEELPAPNSWGAKDEADYVAQFRTALAARGFTHPSPPEGMVGGLQVYRCKIKSRKQIDKEIPRELQGWWADVAAGQKLLLRQAVQSDLDRCTLGGKRSRNPADYMCETHTNGSLVSKVALEYMNPEENVFAAPPTTSAGSGKGE